MPFDGETRMTPTTIRKAEAANLYSLYRKAHGSPVNDLGKLRDPFVFNREPCDTPVGNEGEGKSKNTCNTYDK